MDAVTIVLAVGAVAGLHAAWLIGVRDGANAMATSVGSGALTLRRALVVVVVFELLGALRAGGAVSETLAARLVPLADASQPPVVMAAGVAGALVAAGVWLHVVAALGWPVSSTHAVVGAMLGVGLWASGLAGVRWAVLASVVAGWLVAPALAVLMGYLVFTGLGRRVARSRRPLRRLLRVSPWLAFGIFGTLTFVAIRGGGGARAWATGAPAWALATGAGLCGAVATRLVLGRRVRRLSTAPARVEAVFAVLQWPTTCLIAFAHGSNDAANAVAPMAAVFSLVRGEAGPGAGPVAVPTNLMLIGAFGIVLGLSTFGARLAEALGRDAPQLTPSRAFAIELAAAAVILGATAFGLPVSTSHTLFGAVVGVGLARGFGALDITLARALRSSLLLTVPATAALGAALAAASAAALR